MNYTYIAQKVLRDMGSVYNAIKYCEDIAAANGADAQDYKHAADSLRDVFWNSITNNTDTEAR